MNRKVIISMLVIGWLVVLAISIPSDAEESDSDANSLSLHLEVVSDDANHSEQQIMVQLTAKNEGTEPLLLPHLQEGFIEKYGWWWGWHIFICDSKKTKVLSIESRVRNYSIGINKEN